MPILSRFSVENEITGKVTQNGMELGAILAKVGHNIRNTFLEDFIHLVPYCQPIPSLSTPRFKQAGSVFLPFLSIKVLQNGIELAAIVMKVGPNLENTFLQDSINLFLHHCAIHTLCTLRFKQAGLIFCPFLKQIDSTYYGTGCHHTFN